MFINLTVSTTGFPIEPDLYILYLCSQSNGTPKSPINFIDVLNCRVLVMLVELSGDVVSQVLASSLDRKKAFHDAHPVVMSREN